MPFATTARREVLDRLARDLQASTPDYGRVLERLLRFIEEEQAMTGEVAYTQQRLDLEGGPQIVRVLRLGLAVLYFRTEQARIGWAIPSGEGWEVEMLDAERADIVRARFDAAENNETLGVAELLLPSAQEVVR